MNRKKGNYSCIIVDDDELDRLTILSYTRKYSFLQIDGVFGSAKEALSFSQNSTPDILLLKLKFHEIIYLEALKDYTGIVTRKKKYCVLAPLGNLLKEKSFRTFIRIHRSYAVQKHFIDKITSNEVLVDNMPLPIGRSYKEALDKLRTT
ncbi:LytR/AlgR family response regulator transcription factor [Flavitalea sp.]|nr:response regulator transcription factor [Flavitalea sp.]